MAKQVGPHFMTGTIDGVIFYKLGDQYYVRSKGDYRSGKQMRKDPRLKRTMENADQFGRATRLVKPLYYRYLPREVRKHGLFGKLTGMVHRWLQEGKSKEEVKDALIAHCQRLATVSEQPASQSAATINKQPLLTKDQPLTIGDQSRARIADQSGALITEHRSTINPTPKRARYLSRWKVKRDGRLYIPRVGDSVRGGEVVRE